MDLLTRQEIISVACDGLKARMLEKAMHMPDRWDNREIHRYMSEWLMPVTMDRRAIREYNNDCAISDKL